VREIDQTGRRTTRPNQVGRRLTVALAGAVALGAFALAGTAFAAVNARLEGAFDTKVTVTGGDGPPPPGTVVHRTYKFKPLCDAGACDEVRMSRESSTGNFSKSTLTRIAPGIYEGTEVQTDPRCADGSVATSRVGDIHLEILDRRRGKATKIKGTIHFDVEGCDETFQDGKFVGRR
jgi:hypothetical protein